MNFDKVLALNSSTILKSKYKAGNWLTHTNGAAEKAVYSSEGYSWKALQNISLSRELALFSQESHVSWIK